VDRRDKTAKSFRIDRRQFIATEEPVGGFSLCLDPLHPQ
jgi:hypothetical protein